MNKLRDQGVDYPLVAKSTGMEPEQIVYIADDEHQAHWPIDSSPKRGRGGWKVETSLITLHADPECKTPRLDAVVEVSTRTSTASEHGGTVRIREELVGDLIQQLQNLRNGRLS